MRRQKKIQYHYPNKYCTMEKNFQTKFFPDIYEDYKSHIKTNFKIIKQQNITL